MIDWTKLVPYDNDRYRSFEELCYQLAKGMYGSLGKFTSVDDSGGGDGVEFYLTLSNGEQWGWQAKFYHPDERLSTSSRKASIKGSLKRASELHPNLKKWFLCTPTNLTTGEKTWFDIELSNEVPLGMDVELIHWSESDFIDWLSEPRFSGKRHYFFGELELTMEWFRTQVQKQLAIVRDKFTPELHTDTEIDTRVNVALGHNACLEMLDELLSDLATEADEYAEQFLQMINLDPQKAVWDEDMLEQMQNVFTGFKETIEAAIDFLLALQTRVRQMDLQNLGASDFESIMANVETANKEIQLYLPFTDSLSIFTDDYDVIEVVEWLHYRIKDTANRVSDKIRRNLDVLKLIVQQDLHILGHAGFGKTHLAAHICYERLNLGLPAVLVHGTQLKNDRPLQEQLLSILDIPSMYSWNDFINSMNSAAEAYNTRIPIVIDGLNEVVFHDLRQNIWTTGLVTLDSELQQTKNLILITTCRTTYQELFWENGFPKNGFIIHGFQQQGLEEAVNKYFTWYKIRTEITRSLLTQFEHPIYLKIFCETKNPNRIEEKHIDVGEDSLYEVFEEYLERCNALIAQTLRLRPGTNVLANKLKPVVDFLWGNNDRSIPFDEFVRAVDGCPQEDLNWFNSKSKAILDEGLLVCRDLQENQEVVFFTYDLLGGYLIARSKLKESERNLAMFLNNEQTHSLLFCDDYETLHALYQDIRRSLAALLPMRGLGYLHNYMTNEVACLVSTQTLFELSPRLIDSSGIEYVRNRFAEPTKRFELFEMAFTVTAHPHHPLNMSFWSGELEKLSMPERDLTWTEAVRRNGGSVMTKLDLFEHLCERETPLNDLQEKELHLLAEFSMWVLTSTDRPLRDTISRALYNYGKKYFMPFFAMVEKSLGLNDPYISERMLASLYGIAMAHQKDFNGEYGRVLFDWMFKENALFSTTHILTRDYAKRTIELCLLYNPDLLSGEEKVRIQEPFRDGGLRNWGECHTKENWPISMDFGNYTLGRLVKGRSNYDYTHPEYKKVRAQILWRIRELGYTQDQFEEIDRKLMERNKSQYSLEQSTNGGKIERYGKKYSWIAFYELAGYRKDQGLLETWGQEEVRISDIDIDPSFPAELKKYSLISTNFLGDSNRTLSEWIETDSPLCFESYLIIDELLEEVGPWVLLDGYVNQNSPELMRGRFIFPRGLIVSKEQTDLLTKNLKQQNLGGRWLPEIPTDHYTFAGEVPWCETFSYNGEEELTFSETGETIKVHLPIRENAWESYHSAINQSGNISTPSKEISEFLGLMGKPQTFDLFEQDGRRASISFSHGDKWQNYQRFVYLRKDLLERYLQSQNKELVWAIWGEREYFSSDPTAVQEFAENHQFSKVFQEIYAFGKLNESRPSS